MVMMEQIVFVKFAPAFFQACPLKVEKSAHMSSPSVSHQSAFLLPQKSHTSHIHPQTFPTIFYYIYVDLATIFYYFYYFLLFLTHTYLVFSTYCYTFPNIFYFFPPSHTCSALSTFFTLSTLSLISLLYKSRRTHPPDISYTGIWTPQGGEKPLHLFFRSSCGFARKIAEIAKDSFFHSNMSLSQFLGALLTSQQYLLFCKISIHSKCCVRSNSTILYLCKKVNHN